MVSRPALPLLLLLPAAVPPAGLLYVSPSRSPGDAGAGFTAACAELAVCVDELLVVTALRLLQSPASTLANCTSPIKARRCTRTMYIQKLAASRPPSTS